MKNLEDFKRSRIELDPQSASFSEAQWKRAFEAHKSSRKKVRESLRSRSSRGSSRRRNSSESRKGETTEEKTESSHHESKRVKRPRRSMMERPDEALNFQISATRLTLKQIRADSAYREIRALIDFVAWLTMGLVAASCAVQVLALEEGQSLVSIILNSVSLVLAIAVARPFLQAMLDIPDAALSRNRMSAEMELEKSRDRESQRS